MFKPLLIHVNITGHIKNISNKQDINSPNTMNQPHIYFNFVSTGLLMVYSSIKVLKFNLGSITVGPWFVLLDFLQDLYLLR